MGNDVVNGSGIRDTARVLGISINTVMSELKKKASFLAAVNMPLLYRKTAETGITDVDIVCIEEAEMDEMWSFVKNKNNQRWLWHAIDHNTHDVLAYHIASHKDEAFLALKKKLQPFNIRYYYTDDWGAYQRHLPSSQHLIGKRNTQAIERKHLTLRTRIKRLARRTICFSKLELMYDIVLGLFINRFEFGRAI